MNEEINISEELPIIENREEYIDGVAQFNKELEEEKKAALLDLKEDLASRDDLTKDYLWKALRKKLHRKYDWFMAVSGGRGHGKSTWSILSGFGIDTNFDLKKNVLYIPKAEMIKPKFFGLKPYQVLLIDEGSRGLHKHNWFDKVQQEVNAMYDTERYQYKGTIVNIPNFWNLTPNFRNERVDIWVHIVARGYASIALPDKNRFCEDPWHQKENLKRYWNVLGGRKILDVQADLDRLLKAEQAMDINMGIFEFPPLPDTVDEYYNELKKASRLEEQKNAEGPEEKHPGIRIKKYYEFRNQRNTMIEMLHDKFKMPFKDIAKTIGMTEDALSKARHDGTSYYLKDTNFISKGEEDKTPIPTTPNLTIQLKSKGLLIGEQT
jgi:hypothetical protein